LKYPVVLKTMEAQDLNKGINVSTYNKCCKTTGRKREKAAGALPKGTGPAQEDGKSETGNHEFCL